MSVAQPLCFVCLDEDATRGRLCRDLCKCSALVVHERCFEALLRVPSHSAASCAVCGASYRGVTAWADYHWRCQPYSVLLWVVAAWVSSVATGAFLIWLIHMYLETWLVLPDAIILGVCGLLSFASLGVVVYVRIHLGTTLCCRRIRLMHQRIRWDVSVYV